MQRQEFPKELDVLLRFLREPTTSSIVPKICSIKRTCLGGVCQSIMETAISAQPDSKGIGG